MPSPTEGLPKTDDPVLGAALTEMASEGSFTETPADDTTQPVAAADAGTNPADARNDSAGDNGTNDGAEAQAASEQPTDTPQDAPDSAALLAELQPLTFSVGNETLTVEGIHVSPDGAVVDLDAIPKIQQEFSRARTLESANRDLYQRQQDIDRVTAWRTRDAQGQEQTLTGIPAVEAMRTYLASTTAALQTLTAALKGDPSDLVGVVTDPQTGNPKLVWDPKALEYLTTRSALAEQHAAMQARQYVQGLAQSARAEQQSAEVPQRLWASVEAVWLKEFPQLTADDKQALGQKFQRYIRPANDQEVAAGQFQRGERVVDPDFYAELKDRAAFRDALAKTAQTASAAGKFNAGQNQARTANAKPQPKAPTKPAAPAAKPERVGKQEAWQAPLTAALAEMGISQ